MDALKQKLQSNTGASIVIAMVYLLICLTVGAVVLTAASASVGTARRLKEDRQDYLAVKNAADLLREQVDETTMNLTWYEYMFCSKGASAGSGDCGKSQAEHIALYASTVDVSPTADAPAMTGDSPWGQLLVAMLRESREGSESEVRTLNLSSTGSVASALEGVTVTAQQSGTWLYIRISREETMLNLIFRCTEATQRQMSPYAHNDDAASDEFVTVDEEGHLIVGTGTNFITRYRKFSQTVTWSFSDIEYGG